MNKNPILLYKTLVVGIIVLFIGTCIVPSVNSVKSNGDTVSYNQPDFSDLWAHPDGTQSGIINSLNLWTSKPQSYRTNHNPINYQTKSTDFKNVKKSSISTSNGKTLYVGGDGPGNYSSIGLAVYLAEDGDTVFVYSGTYHILPRGISIDKSINLIGEDKDTTIIDGTERHVIERVPILKIGADGITVSGFTIQNQGGFDAYDCGITIYSSHNNISGNIIKNNNCGILLGWPNLHTDYNIISNNIFLDNVEHGLVLGKANNNIISDNVFHNDEIVLSRAQNNIVSDNVFYNGGVWLSDAYQNTLLNNLVNDKPLIYLEDESDKVIDEDAGQVILVNCNNITVQNKDLCDTTFGIILENTNNCYISGNTISSNKLGGIFLIWSSNNNISTNTLSDTTNGILLFYSNDNIIFSNTITLNDGFGIYLAYSEGNTISMNIISDNYIGLVLTGGSNFNNIQDNIFINDGGAWVYGAWKNTFLNNSINDKPIIYLEDESDKVIDEDAGQVILVSCENIEVKDQEMSNTYAGIMIVASNNCKISNSNFNSHKRYGIFITHSNNNNVTMNIVSNSNTGIALDASEDNIIFWNAISSNENIGIHIYVESNGNTILSNNIKENEANSAENGGIFIDSSSNNKIHNNNFLSNKKGYYFLLCTSNIWNGNYWDKPRIFPKLILGRILGIIILWPWINIDWHPAQEPYDI